jgi:hypothetical protein
MPTGAGTYINLSFVAINGSIIGFSQLQASDSLTLDTLTLTTGLTAGANNTAIGVGYVGNIYQSTVTAASAVVLTTTTVTEITNIALPAGKYWISANPSFQGTGVTATELQAFLATAAGTSVTGQDTDNTSYCTPFVVGSTSRATATIKGYYYAANSSTTVYLKGKATYTVGAIVAWGGITALRLP